MAEKLDDSCRVLIEKGGKQYATTLGILKNVFLSKEGGVIDGTLKVEPKPNQYGSCFHITGETSDEFADAHFFYYYKNPSGTLDAINYKGAIKSAQNIVNKGYLDERLKELEDRIKALEG